MTARNTWVSKTSRPVMVAVAAAMLTMGAWPAFASADVQAASLGALPGGRFSFALAANNVGQVVGQSEVAGGVSHPFLWTKSGGMIDLGLPPGDTQGFATGINDAGQVSGDSIDNTAGIQRAFVWSPTDGMLDLGSLPGGTNAVTKAINSSG